MPFGIVSANKDEIYTLLPYRWTTTFEIRDKIAELKGVERVEIYRVSLTYLIHLKALTREGLAENRERDPTDKERKEHPTFERIFEYRKIQDGIREPNFAPEGGLERALAPA